MARHVDIVTGEAVDGDSESGTLLAKKIYDTVNGATFVSMAASVNGRYVAVVIITDDA
jgi:hypothetical protein